MKGKGAVVPSWVSFVTITYGFGYGWSLGVVCHLFIEVRKDLALSDEVGGNRPGEMQYTLTCLHVDYSSFPWCFSVNIGLITISGSKPRYVHSMLQYVVGQRYFTRMLTHVTPHVFKKNSMGTTLYETLCYGTLKSLLLSTYLFLVNPCFLKEGNLTLVVHFGTTSAWGLVGQTANKIGRASCRERV